MNSGGVYDTSCVRGGLSGDGSTAFPQKPDDTIEIDLDLDELDATSAETKAAYQEIKDYVLKEFDLKVSNLYISQVKRKCGIEMGENYNLPIVIISIKLYSNIFKPYYGIIKSV